MTKSWQLKSHPVTEIIETAFYFYTQTLYLFEYGNGWDSLLSSWGCSVRRANKGNTLHLPSLWNRKWAVALSERFTSSCFLHVLWGDTYVHSSSYLPCAERTGLSWDVFVNGLLSLAGRSSSSCGKVLRRFLDAWSPDPQLGPSMWA